MIDANHDQYVYMLWTHDESGPENLVATLDPSLLPAMAKSLNVELDQDILQNLIGKPQIVPLTTEWGGLHVQVVRLDAK